MLAVNYTGFLFLVYCASCLLNKLGCALARRVFLLSNWCTQIDDDANNLSGTEQPQPRNAKYVGHSYACE